MYPGINNINNFKCCVLYSVFGINWNHSNLYKIILNKKVEIYLLLNESSLVFLQL